MNFSLQFAMQLPQNSLKKIKEDVFTVILHCLAMILYFLFTDLFSNIQLGTSKPNLNQVCYRSAQLGYRKMSFSTFITYYLTFATFAL